MALVEVCFFLVFLLFLGLLFPFMQLFMIIVSPQIEWVALEKPIKHNVCDTPYQYEENSFADAILWADVGNDL